MRAATLGAAVRMTVPGLLPLVSCSRAPNPSFPSQPEISNEPRIEEAKGMESSPPETDTKTAELKSSTGESQGIGEERTRLEADPGLVEPEPSAGESLDVIGEAAALEIAAQALKAYDPLPGDSRPTVELKGDRYIVTYPHRLSPGARGSSFHVKVHIDARTGKVLGLQGGV